MISDYGWPSVYFSYLFFAILFALAFYFLLRSRRDGYWGEHSEDPKFQMLKED